MSQITITYSVLEDVVSSAKRTATDIQDYINAINNNISVPSGNVPAPNDNSYVSTAGSLAKTKVEKLQTIKTSYNTFATNVTNFEQFAKDTDTSVATTIDTLADTFIGNRNWLQKCGDWLYNTFCVDIANEFAIFRVFNYIGNLYSTWQDIKELATRKLADWFKYGNGKYVWKIAKAVIGTIAAIAGLIAAIVALPVTGGLTLPLVIGLIGVVATTIGTIITIGNSAATIYSAGKAWKLDNEGKDGAARYYSDSTKISDVLGKYDFGGKKENVFGGKYII